MGCVTGFTVLQSKLPRPLASATIVPHNQENEITHTLDNVIVKFLGFDMTRAEGPATHHHRRCT